MTIYRPATMAGAGTGPVNLARGRRERHAPLVSGVGPKRQEMLFANVVAAADVAVLVASFFAAYLLRARVSWPGELLPLTEFVWVLGLIVVLWPTLARSVGLTASQTYLRPRRLMLLTARVHVIGALALFSSLYMLRAVEVSRLLMQTFLAISALGFVAERMMIRSIMLGNAAGAHSRRRSIVIGTTVAAGRFQRLLNTMPHWGGEVAGYLIVEGASAPTFASRPVLGRLRDLEPVLDSTVVDDVVLATPLDVASVDRLVEVCAERGLTFHALVDMPAPPRARHHAEALGGGLYLMSLERTPQRLPPLFAKRALDLAVALPGLAVFAIAYAIVAPLIKLGSAGPVIFKQQRVGRNGRPFTLYKFRTMGRDAEALKASLAAANGMRGHVFKIVSDPRVTPVGRVLRAMYVDELPQFWNVVKGDMSLVGPRPPLPEEVAGYAPYHRRRLSVRPGITGPWQATGNGAVGDFEDVVRLESDYIDHWSFWGDVQLLFRTCATIARMAGH